jgi:uncharacterized membrane protein YjfL (UPF0719 family)
MAELAGEAPVTGFAPLNALLYAALGVVVWLCAVAVAARLAPFDVWKQVVQERNPAAAAVVAAAALGLAWIVAAAMH